MEKLNIGPENEPEKSPRVLPDTPPPTKGVEKATVPDAVPLPGFTEGENFKFVPNDPGRL